MAKRGMYLGTVREVLTWPENRLPRVRRAGVVLRLHYRGGTALGFSVHAGSSGQLLGDFGGSVECAEHPIHAALREGLEETCDVLHPWLQLHRLKHAKVYVWMDTLYILVEVHGLSPGTFQQRYCKARTATTSLCETSGVVCIPCSILRTILTSERPQTYEGYRWDRWLWASLRGLPIKY